MKKILLLATVGMLSLTSCDDFLDASNYQEADTNNFPAIPNDLNRELAALYGVMNQFSTAPLQTPWFAWDIMSDDANGAGATGDVESHAVGHLMANSDNMFADAWHNTYVGIARASAIIYSVDAFDWTGNEVTRNQLLGEAYFMRGLFYLWGVQLWGDIPAYWGAAAPDPCPQVSAKDVTMPHIIADFLSAYNLMTNGATVRGDGHATKGAAAGFLARAYMFYEGFYLKAGELASANLAPIEFDFEQEGVNGPLTKQVVADALLDCINNSGARLIDDYRLLWQYTNELTAPDYAYTQDLAQAGKYWAGNGNVEQLFQIQYCNSGSWSGNIGMGFINQASLYCSLRVDDCVTGEKDPQTGNTYQNGYQNTFPYGQGWGQAVVNYNSYDEWTNASDKRKDASVLNCEKELERFCYTIQCTEETGLYNKKWCMVTCSGTNWAAITDTYTWWGVYRANNTDAANSNGNSMQGDHYADMVLMRLSDVMLMHTELTGDPTWMNKVQERAGVTKTGYSLKAIQDERRWEFFGEGIRFNDLRRWSGIDGGAGCMAAQALEKQAGSKVNYTGRWTTMKQASCGWAQRYAQTNGFVQIPQKALNIFNDPEILKQNPGWESTNADWFMTGTPVY